jgi:GntR family transcriptional regulator
MIPLKLDRSSPIPLYYQLREQLREAIKDGRLEPHVALPTEPELAERVGVSRFTLRQAIDELVREGLVRRERGRGTFVAEVAKPPASDLRFRLDWDLDGQAGEQQIRVLRSGPVSPPADVGEALGLAPRDIAVEVVRLRLRGATPTVSETMYLPATLAPDSRQLDLDDRRLYALLERRHNFTISHADQTVRSVALSRELARTLDGSAGSVGLEFERLTFAGERPIDLRRGTIAGLGVTIHLSLRRGELDQD